MSVIAFPSVKKITMVDAMEDGFDQKKTSMNLVAATSSQSPTKAMRIPNCADNSTHVGQMRRTGRRRASRRRVIEPVVVLRSGSAVAESMKDDLAFMTASPDQASSVRLANSGGGLLLAQMQQVEAVFFHGDEARR